MADNDNITLGQLPSNVEQETIFVLCSTNIIGLAYITMVSYHILLYQLENNRKVPIESYVLKRNVSIQAYITGCKLCMGHVFFSFINYNRQTKGGCSI